APARGALPPLPILPAEASDESLPRVRPHVRPGRRRDDAPGDVERLARATVPSGRGMADVRLAGGHGGGLSVCLQVSPPARAGRAHSVDRALAAGALVVGIVADRMERAGRGAGARGQGLPPTARPPPA